MAGDEQSGKSLRRGVQSAVPGIPVFVSYAAHDRDLAKTIVEGLEQQGIGCWIAPRDVTPGRQKADEIVAAINDAKVVVLVLSEHVFVSPHVGPEIERAAAKHRGIIILRTDTAPLTRSFEYFLNGSQWIELGALGLPAALVKLTQAVRQRVTPSWVSPGLGIDVRNPADRTRKPSYRVIKRTVIVALLLAVAAVVFAVFVLYWPSKQRHSATQDKSMAIAEAPHELRASVKQLPARAYPPGQL